MARAGKVAITPKGTFENGTVYDKLDTVEYNGTLYIAKKASSGVLPTDTEYWMLAVDLTGKMDTTGDSKNNIVTFTSADATDPTGWQDVQVLTSKEKHLSLFNKISTMMSNMRYLYKILGTTDISELGSVTQAIANLNSNVGGIKGISSSAAITTQGQYALDAREKNASVDGTLANKIDVLNSNFNNFNNYILKEFVITVRAGEVHESILVEDYVVMVCPKYTYEWYLNVMIPFMHTDNIHHRVGIMSANGKAKDEDVTYSIIALCKIN